MRKTQDFAQNLQFGQVQLGSEHGGEYSSLYDKLNPHTKTNELKINTTEYTRQVLPFLDSEDFQASQLATCEHSVKNPPNCWKVSLCPARMR